ncbi:MAG: hypothetical protein IIU87_08130, partial [Prevotella sp.]|nr:hypothetical protein [Prevotella sp.]
CGINSKTAYFLLVSAILSVCYHGVYVKKTHTFQVIFVEVWKMWKIKWQLYYKYVTFTPRG